MTWCRNMPSQERKLLLKIILDVFILILVFLPVPIFHFAVYPFKRGFHCDDESLMYPYKDDTVTKLTLALVGLLVPSGMMLLNEGLLVMKRSRSKVNKSTGADLEENEKDSAMILCRRQVHPLLVAFYKAFGAFLFGGAVCFSATNVMKYYLGRLRPHFLTVCKPNYNAFGCKDARQVFVYVEGDFCTGDEDLIKKARLSHPSGHASMSVYCAIYLVIYLQVRFKWRISKLIRPLLQVIIIYLAMTCCVSRITDYKHHWSDVLGGAALGTVSAILTAYYASDLFVGPKVTDLWNLLKNRRNDEILMQSPVSESCTSPNTTVVPSEYRVMMA